MGDYVGKKSECLRGPLVEKNNASLWSRFHYTWLRPLLTTSLNKWKWYKKQTMRNKREKTVLPLNNTISYNLVDSDLGDIPLCFASKTSWSMLQKAKLRQVVKRTSKTVAVSAQTTPVISANHLTVAICKMIHEDLVLSGIFKAISEISLLIHPLLLFYFLNALSGNAQMELFNHSISSYHFAYVLGIAILIFSSFSSYSSKRSMEILRYAGTTVQSALCAEIYQKLFRLAPHTKSAITNGRILALITSDSRRIDTAIDHLHVFWLCPLQIIITSGFLFWILGPAAGAGLALIIGSVPLQYLIVRKLAKKRTLAITATDARVRFVDQVLNGIRVIVLNDWGDAFCKQAEALRAKELSAQWTLHFLISLLITFMHAIPIMASLVAFAATSLLMPTAATTLSTSTIFSAIAMFGQLRSAIGTFPPFLSRLIDAKISLKRISEFLCAQELSPLQLGPIEMNTAIEIRGLWASWSNIKSEETTKSTIPMEIMESFCSLKDVTLSIPKGATSILVGPIGSGKSSLLQAILGEVNVIAGNICLAPSKMAEGNRFGYSQQKPWIKRGSLRENVLFGCKFNASRYGAVLSVCQLRTDIKGLPLGDLTEIGGATSTLSGGQCQRIGLARALYADPEILLLDDPISALDPKVAKIVWEHAVAKSSTLGRGKTKIIATHALHLIQKDSCDWVVCMDQGHIRWQGPPVEWLTSDAKKRLDSTFPPPINHDHQALQVESPVEMPTSYPHTSSFAINSTKTIQFLGQISAYRSPEQEIQMELFMEKQTQDTESIFADELRELETFEEGPRKGHLFTSREENDELYDGQATSFAPLSLSIYLLFLRRFGWFLFLCAISFIALTNFSRITTEKMLSQTGDNFFEHGWMIWQMAFIFITSAGLFTFITSMGAWYATDSTYRDAFSNVIKMAPLFFTENFPLGFLMSRFTKDVETMDFDLLVVGRDLLQRTFEVLSILILVAFTMVPWVALLLLMLLLSVNWGILRLYHQPMLDLESLCSRARSTYLGQIGSTLGGLPLIRSRTSLNRQNNDNSESIATQMNHESSSSIKPSVPASPPVQSLFVANNLAANDRLIVPTLLLASLQAWASLRFELTAHLCVTATALFCVYWRISPALAGLVLHQLLTLAKSLYNSITSFASLELAFCSFRRLCELGDESEASISDTSAHHPPFRPTLSSHCPARVFSPIVHKQITELSMPSLLHSDWPYEGAIEFSNVTLSYAPRGGRPILCDINFEVKPGERLAIIGRTGSGKSTLVQALFGLIPVSEGSIKIDNVDISCISGALIRQRLAIIPQEPVVFYGRTLRFNLDPLQIYTDERIWEMLDACAIGSHLRETLEPPALDAILREGSGAFSQGQSQLLCLTRALLKNSRILVLDEAISNVDKALDTFIQKTIRRVASSKLGSSASPGIDSFIPDHAEHPVTVITIAHRLLSILDYDRIMVLQDGFIAELDTPHTLFKNQDSLFTQLVRELGDAEYQYVSTLLLNKPAIN